MNSFPVKANSLPMYPIAVLMQVFQFLRKVRKHGSDGNISLDACSYATDFYEYFIEHYPD